MKITFLGDIMCEPPVLAGARQKDGSYNFDYVFARAQGLIDEADYVVGNLETPMAGPEALYSQGYMAFNAPDAYADAIKKAGIDLVATANNHTFDRGYDGMERTIRVLDEKGIPHHGSFLRGTPRTEAHYATVGDTTVAIIAYTYGTNYGGSGGKYAATGEYAGTVNLLRPQDHKTYLPGVPTGKTWFDKLTIKFLSANARGKIKRFFGFPSNAPRADDLLLEEACKPYVEQFQADIRKAKEKADIVLFYPHMGGQFLHRVGNFSQYITQKAVESGADAVIASHSHVVQKIGRCNGILCAYSLGNFNMTPDSGVAVLENRTGYGIALHLQVEEKKLTEVSFSIIANIWEGKGISGCPVDELHPTLSPKKQKKLEEDVRYVYKVLTEKELTGEVIRREYPFEG